MYIYYSKTCKWEFDFFKNDIFKQNLYNTKIKFILFDNNTEINRKDENNIIVCNSAITLNFLKNMIKKLKPFIIFHLSDERGNNIKYYNLYSKYNIKLLFYQYNFEKTNYNINNFQIPLGYVSGFLLNNPSINSNKIGYNKKYFFSFIGQLKGDRRKMLHKFSKKFKSNYIHTGKTYWSQGPENQNIKPCQMFDIYRNSLFVPIGRGNKTLDCYRVYEAIIAGAIPVICGSIEEINITFNFNNNKIPHIIIGDTWNKAVLLCKELYNDKDRINDIINSNNRWFQKQIINISKQINKLLQ
tara:strand:+ start:160 stop:1056 length:897 start_codon:yes stop_codon:yes gene_type:complete